MSSGGLVAVVGSRSLPAGSAEKVARFVARIVDSGRGVAVGCACGADAFALTAALKEGGPVRVFAVGGESGEGFWRCSAPLSLLRRAPRITWWAGGPAGVPLRARLAARSRACVLSSVGVLAFVSGGPRVSPGSWGSIRAAVRAGRPVVVVPLGLSPAALPALGRGRWVALSGPWAGAFRWRPAGGRPL